MKKNKLSNVIKWIARIWGTIILAITVIALMRGLFGERPLFGDWKSIVLYIGLILGLSSAYKWELIGGIITTLGIILSGFIHPFVAPVGVLYLIHWFISRRGEAPHNDV